MGEKNKSQANLLGTHNSIYIYKAFKRKSNFNFLQFLYWLLFFHWNTEKINSYIETKEQLLIKQKGITLNLHT